MQLQRLSPTIASSRAIQVHLQTVLRRVSVTSLCYKNTALKESARNIHISIETKLSYTTPNELTAFLYPKCTQQDRVCSSDQSGCAKCVDSAAGLTCCAKGGSWDGNCGRKNDKSVDHTWTEGMKVCAQKAAARQTINTAVVHKKEESNFSETFQAQVVDMASVTDMATPTALLIVSMYYFAFACI